MSSNRWIFFPFIIILSYVLPRLFFGTSGGWLLYWCIVGAIVGFLTLLWSDAKARKITGKNDAEIYQVRQKRVVSVLLNYERTFEICREAVESLNPAKIKVEDLGNGIIQFRTRVNWSTWGHIITLTLKKLNDNLTEVEISTRPIPRTVMVSSGYSWKYVEEICHYLQAKDIEINRKILVDSVEVLNDIYIKPFQKDKIEL